MKTTSRGAAFVLVAALAVTACGSSTKSNSASPTTTVATTAVATSVGGAPASPTTTAGSGSNATVTGPGVTATTITIGQIATVSGPVPGLFQNAADSMDAFAAYVNGQGGIDGRKLIVVHKDDAYDCVTYTNDLKQFATQVFAVVGTWSVEDGCGESVLKATPTLPDIEGSILNPELYALSNAFAPEPQPPGYPTTGYVWIKNKYPADITHTAALYPASASFSYKSQSITAASLGYNYVYSRGIGNTETEFTSDVLRMKADGVKLVDLSSMTVTGIATFVQEAAQQNFHPDAIIAPTAYDSTFFPLLGKGTATANNVIIPEQFPMYLGQDRATNPELATYLTALGKEHSGEAANLFGTASWGAAVLFAQGMQQAGANVTQASLIAALNRVDSFNADGLLPTSSPGERAGAHCEVIIGVSGATFTRLDPATSGFECNGVFNNIPISKLVG